MKEEELNVESKGAAETSGVAVTVLQGSESYSGGCSRKVGYSQTLPAA